MSFADPFFFARRRPTIPALPDKESMLKLLLGRPHVMRGPLIDAARALKAPVLISANALSVWKKDANGIPVWHRFNSRNLHHLNDLEAILIAQVSWPPADIEASPGLSTITLISGQPTSGAGSHRWICAWSQKSPEAVIWSWTGFPERYTSTAPVSAAPESEESSIA